MKGRRKERGGGQLAAHSLDASRRVRALPVGNRGAGPETCPFCSKGMLNLMQNEHSVRRPSTLVGAKRRLASGLAFASTSPSQRCQRHQPPSGVSEHPSVAVLGALRAERAHAKIVLVEGRGTARARGDRHSRDRRWLSGGGRGQSWMWRRTARAGVDGALGEPKAPGRRGSGGR